ncbi:unnamed protein product [Rotaria magnacalcarata]|nr:unnamed protein product [Rotaria magnacalcarata]
MYTDYNESVKAIDIGELYEHSLSIRYCYPHILELKSEKPIMNQDEQNKLIEQLPEAEEVKKFEENLLRQKFIPTINGAYGSRTLFRFSDSEFFCQHIDQCCRVAAVYAFFLLEHSRNATSYIVKYDRNTHEVCEVEMEKLLADVFYNRNCYASLYGVEQKDRIKRQPTTDLDHSVDRTDMTNRHQAQFIGQDL